MPPETLVVDTDLARVTRFDDSAVIHHVE
ncbi:MAG: hypothetical protein J07HX5_00745, partial [halophilic archaeon J07HX5]